MVSVFSQLLSTHSLPVSPRSGTPESGLLSDETCRLTLAASRRPSVRRWALPSQECGCAGRYADRPSIAAQPVVTLAICCDLARVMPPSAITGRRDNLVRLVNLATPNVALPGCVRVANTGEISTDAGPRVAFARASSRRSCTVTSRISPQPAPLPGAP